MKVSLDSIYYLYNYYIVYVLLFYTHYMMSSCNMILWYPWYITVIYDIVMWYFSILLPCVVSLNKKGKEKEKKRNINNNLAIFPSHNSGRHSSNQSLNKFRFSLGCSGDHWARGSDIYFFGLVGPDSGNLHINKTSCFSFWQIAQVIYKES